MKIKSLPQRTQRTQRTGGEILPRSVRGVDFLIIIIAVGVVLVSGYNAYLKPQDSVRVLIKGQGKEWVFPLETKETIVVAGPLGNTVVQIDTDRAWVESSPCSNQTCTASGSIHRLGQWAACLPNNVLVVIQGSSVSLPEDVDVIVR